MNQINVYNNDVSQNWLKVDLSKIYFWSYHTNELRVDYFLYLYRNEIGWLKDMDTCMKNNEKFENQKWYTKLKSNEFWKRYN